MPVTINGGELRFLQRIKTGDYEHKEASALFTFSTPDGESATDEDRDAVATRVVEQVGKMLKLTAKAPPGRPRLPTPVKSEPATVADVPADVGETPVEDVTTDTRPDVTDADLHAAVAAKVAALTEAKVEGGPKLVKALIFAHAVPPAPDVKPQLGMVPQARRREFLARLAEIVA